MNSLMGRGRDLESQYHHNQLHEFKILRTRNRLFGSWVVKTLNMTEDQYQTLMHVILDPVYCTVKGELLIQKVLALFTEQGRSIPESHLHKQLDYFYQDAVRDSMGL